jgi:hypothetical protein
MSITTNAELGTAVGNYLARADLSSYIPDFVKAGEARFTYGSGAPGDPFYCPALRVRAMETAADVTVTAGVGAIPTGFLGARRVYWNSSPKHKIEQTSPEDFYGKWIGSESGSVPSHYIIEGESFILGPSVSGTMKLLYYKSFDAVATASPVPWLLTNHPMVYVYSALLEAAPFIRNDQRLTVWASLLRSAVQGLNGANMADRWSGSALAVRNDVGNP